MSSITEEQEVAVVPGTAFGQHGANHVRASFSTSYEKLVMATDRIEKFITCLDLENKSLKRFELIRRKL